MGIKGCDDWTQTRSVRADRRQISRQVTSSDAHGLSRRELRVLQHTADGGTGTQIAEELFVSPPTVQNDLDSVYAKLGVLDRASAVAYALHAGLVN